MLSVRQCDKATCVNDVAQIWFQKKSLGTGDCIGARHVRWERPAFWRGSDRRLFSCAISNISFSFWLSFFFISVTSSFKVFIRSRLLCVMSL